MSRRFRLYSWIVAVSDMLIGSVFLTAHPAMKNTPTWHYVLLLIPWQAWCCVFLSVGFCMAGAIGTGKSYWVRKVACVSTIALLIWAVEFALIIPAIIAGTSASWMGIVLVGSLAALQMVYLGMPASPWLDFIDDAIPGEYVVTSR